ncbi:IclR family transcriptional regulator domain-containing protein [Paraburkholderia diazotrophica]|uniref:IclR family transcriptional regulator domain-containing protein n=1 Tax=Paraburkholderia diazotrophica TaxID=667676 RepID=UPI001FED1965|nr:IclR family transcriptional regulator C-terminal domain-containing protein [Paraburkholderia diazotrophica]
MSDRTPEQRDVLLGSQPYAGRTEFTVRDRTALYAELNDVRKRGSATNRNENVTGICAVGTRLSAPSRRASGAIVLTGPSRSFDNGDEAMRDDPTICRRLRGC